MIAAKHVNPFPAPWVFAPLPSERAGWFYVSYLEPVEAPWIAYRVMGLGNARLIAAAPDLLAALEAVAEFWAGGDVPAELDAQMRGALAKARGEA